MHLLPCWRILRASVHVFPSLACYVPGKMVRVSRCLPPPPYSKTGKAGKRLVALAGTDNVSDAAQLVRAVTALEPQAQVGCQELATPC